MGLKRRFRKDKKFFLDYLKFIDNLLRSGYAKRSVASLSGKTWYISHHGVYHPSKLGKINVFFDYSSKFQGRSINKELLSEPDLTNQIIFALILWRKNCLHDRSGLSMNILHADNKLLMHSQIVQAIYCPP